MMMVQNRGGWQTMADAPKISLLLAQQWETPQEGWGSLGGSPKV